MRMIMTMTRSLRETVVFKHPFRIASIERLLPAGSYEVITDEESIEGLSFPSFRPVATVMMVPAPPRSSSVEMITISSIDLADSREPMRWRPDSDARVDRGITAPNTDILRTMAQIESNAKALREPARLATIAKPLVGALLELKEPGRDLRIDVCRGIALWFIF